MRYFSSFVAGTGDVVDSLMRLDLLDYQTVQKFDGLVVYESSSAWEKVGKVKYLNNSYLLLTAIETKSFENFKLKVGQYFKDRGREVWDLLYQVAGDGGLTYRLMFYDRNQPTGIDKNQLEQIERFISGGKLVDRTHPTLELTATYRSEGWGFLGVRLTYHPDYKKVLNQGELRPELAEIMVRITDPLATDVVLDPFAGFGSIVASRLGHQLKRFFAIDKEKERVDLLKRRFAGDQKIIIRQADAMNLNMVGDLGIDVIITDPPWGNYDKSVDLENLYRGMLVEFGRVMHGASRMVILTAAQKEFESLVEELGFAISKRWNILVSGRQASIYKVAKKG